MASMGKIEIVLSEEVRQFIKQVQSGSSGCSGADAGQTDQRSDDLAEEILKSFGFSNTEFAANFETVSEIIKRSAVSGRSSNAKLERISEALSEYHGALNARKNSSLAASKFVGECEMILQFRRSQ